MRQKCKSRPKTWRQACLLSNLSKQYLARTLTLSKRSCARLPAQREGLSEVMNKIKDLGTRAEHLAGREGSFIAVCHIADYWERIKKQNQKPQGHNSKLSLCCNTWMCISQTAVGNLPAFTLRIKTLPGRDLHVLRSAGLCSSASCLWLV